MTAMCSLFLRKGGSITCTITGPRKFSADLVQGRMEVPIYLLLGDGDVANVEKLLQISKPSKFICIEHESESEHQLKHVKGDVDLDEPRHVEESDVWV